jgi:hypothetical protein
MSNSCEQFSAHSLMASRILAMVVLANFFTMSATTLLSPRVSWTPLIWLAGLGAAALLLRVRYVRKPKLKNRPRYALWVLGITLTAISLPRVTYLLAAYPSPYNFALPRWDDWAHVAELVAMTASADYPLRLPFNPDFLFSYYYASLYPAAIVKLLLPFAPLNSLLFFNTLGYGLGIGLSVIELSR